MRIIAGEAGGLTLETPKTLLRPSTDRLREALFSILGASVVGSRMLDLFAGSGAVGLEALSRGASAVTFVEIDRRAAACIERNLAKARLRNRAEVIRQDAFLALKRMRGAFDLIFADPPYHKRQDETDLAGRLLLDPMLPEVLADGGRLILERGTRDVGDPPAPWQPRDVRSYGESHLHFLGKAGSAGG